MKTGRRLILMTAGLLVLCSSSLAWIDGQMPINTSFGAALSTMVSTVSNHSVTLNISFLNQISMAAVLFVAGVIILVASVLGSRIIALVSAFLAIIITLMWIIATGISLDGFINHFAGLGTGTHLALLGIIIALLAILFPRLHWPGRSDG